MILDQTGQSSTQHDAIIVRLVISLTAVVAALVLALLVASLLGIVQPNCDHLPPNNRVGGCYVDSTAPPSPRPQSVSLIGVDATLK